MKMKVIALAVTSLWMSAAWADWFCPNNFNAINVGDSIATVIAACGKPDTETSNKQAPPEPMEWTYYVAASPNVAGSNVAALVPTGPNQGGTMKMTVAFSAEGKAINISVNGSGMPQTSLCANGQIELGDTPDMVTTACGKPDRNDAQQQSQGQPQTEITELTYNGTPAVTLTFVDGKLTERK